MSPTQHPSPNRLARFRTPQPSLAAIAGAALLALMAVPAVSHAQSTWNGSASSDWNTAANWSAGVPSGVDAIIATNLPNIATISNTLSATPVDIKIGWFGGNGRVDHISGDAGTGDNNWMWVGIVGNQATYNFADTRIGGGTFTGYGQGSGNLNVGGSLQNGNILLGLDNGTVATLNINSSGTLSGAGLFAGANGGANGIVNMDSGTVNLSGECQIGAFFFNQGSGTNNQLNLSGGTLTANIVSIARGNNASSIMKGVVNVTGGILQSKQWFTLGFAGSAAALATVTNNGGTINVNTSGGGNMEMTVFDPISAYFKQVSGALNICNSANILFGAGGNNSGTATLDQTGGTVTFYSDLATTVGGSGYLSLGQAGDSGSYTYNLNGGTLTIPSITRTATSGSGVFNFNGGTLKPTATTATFMQGLTAANVNAGGANIDTAGSDITIAQSIAGAGVLTKLGAGTLTLSGFSTYTGNTVISNGTLALSGTATLASQVVIPASRTLDVTTLTVGIQNPVSGVGSVTGNATAAVGMDIYPGTDGTAGTLTFNNDLNMNAGGAFRLDLSTVNNTGNDQVVVTGNLTLSSAASVRIKALSGAANLATNADYVLCAVTGTTTMGSTPSLVWDGTTPANYLSFSVQQSGNNLVLHYTPAVAPTVSASASPATAVRNQRVTVTATVTPGTGSVTNVVADASQIGGSSTAKLVLSGTPNVYTNSFVVGSSIAPGVKFISVVAAANTGLSSPASIATNTIVATNEVWTGAGANDNWSTSPNWSIVNPANSGDAVTFAGTTRLTPNLDTNLSVTGVTFDATAGSFNLGTANGSTLTLTANGIVNLSANPQVVSVPVTLSGSQTLNTSAGSLTLSNTLNKASNLLTVTGTATTVLSGPISGSGSLFKKGSGILTVTTNATWDLAQATSGGFSSPLMAQAGTVKLTGGSVQTVTGELVIGGVIANGGAGNDAKIVVDGATLNVSSWFSIGRGNGVGGVSSELVLTNGAVVSAQNVSAGYNGGNSANKPKGAINLNDTSALTVTAGNFFVGESDGSDVTMNVNGNSTVTASGATLNVGINSGTGALNLNGGTVSVGALRVGAGANASSTAKGTVTVNSGTFSSEGDVLLGFAGNANGDIGKMIINGGTVNVATATKRWFIMNQWDTCTSQLDVNGGTLNINANTDIRYAIGNNTGTNTINLNAGAITFYSDNATTVGGSGVVDMHQGNGSTVQNIFNLNGGTLSVSAILTANATGTRTFNFNGGTLKATAAGTLMDLGTGNAHAYVRSNGAVVDDNGNSVIIATALEHFSGDVTDGGLTKKGSGLVYCTGANSYTGNTVVQNGTLELAQATLATNATVSVSSNAFLQLDFSTTNQVAALVLGGVSKPAGVYNSGNVGTFITGSGSLLVQASIATNPTNLTFSASGGSLNLSWPADHAGWILQTQTNNRSIGLTTGWIDIPGTASVTATNFPVSTTSETVFFRLRIP